MTNCVGGSIIVDAARKNKVKKFIYFQTALCYGLKPQIKPIPLDHPIKPEGSSYAISKTTNELYLELSGLDYVTFRLANVVGPRNLQDGLFLSRLKKGQKCFVTDTSRDFVFVRFSKNSYKGLRWVGNGTYHFSSGEDIKINKLYDEIVKAMKLNHHPKPSASTRTRCVQ